MLSHARTGNLFLYRSNEIHLIWNVKFASSFTQNALNYKAFFAFLYRHCLSAQGYPSHFNFFKFTENANCHHILKLFLFLSIP